MQFTGLVCHPRLKKYVRIFRICRQLLPQEELPFSPVERPEGPWIQIGLESYSFEFDHYLTIQDYYLKWPEVCKLKETTTRAVFAMP